MISNSAWPQALRMLGRDWRGGELRLLAAALVVAVAAVSSVGFFVDRVRQGLQRDAAQFLGADAVVDSDRPIDPQWVQEAASRQLRSAHTVSFPSMASAPGVGSDATGATMLVSVKAVSPGYPLRGALQLQGAGGTQSADAIPPPGSVWVDPAVLRALGIALGQTLQLGKSRLRATALIAVEPDRSMQVVGFAPRVMLNDQDLAGTGLVQPASRVSYRWLIAGAPDQLRSLLNMLKGRLQRGQRLESIEDGRPEMQRTLGRAERFLGLVALVSVLICAVAVANAARRFTTQRLDACALMRCLGLAQSRIMKLFVIELALVGLGASALGVLGGLGLHLVLMRLLTRLLQENIPLPTALPALQGLACGLLLLLGFAVPPLEQLRRVSPVRVLRHDIGAPAVSAVLAYGAGAAALGLLLVWTAGDVKLGAIVAAGFLGAVGSFALAALLALRALRLLRRAGSQRLGVVWRFALAAVQRRPGASVVQLVSLAMGLMALLLLAIVRTDLVDQWRGQAPLDAPNQFIINIQPDQVEDVRAQLAAAGLKVPLLEPMIRGRLVAIDGRRVGPDDYTDERTRGLIEREFNLSYRSQAPLHNTLVQGRWFAPEAAELSIEEGIAQRLHIQLGQRLRFDVAGQSVEATVSSVRKVDWNSMRVNFFVIMAPPLLRDAPQSYITAFYLPVGQADQVAALVRRFPNLTVIDTGQVLAQVRGLLDQVVAATQFLFAFALAAGVLVLYTALVATHDERRREAALLRALGASRRQLARAQTVEMVLQGTLAGLLAALGAATIAWALAHFAFEFNYTFHAWILFAGVAGGIGAALLGSGAGLRRILATPPLVSLREA